MTLKPSRQLVRKKVRDCFPDPAIGRLALTILDSYGTEPWHRQKDRVGLALLKTSSADLDKLQLCTEGAKSDHRDVLIPSEFYEESQSSSKTPPDQMTVIRSRDHDDYQRWLTLSLASRELVQRKVMTCFPDPTVAREAVGVLCEYGAELWHREKQRTQMAILHLSSGDLDALRARTQHAQTDFRRTLFLAECAEESKLAHDESPELLAAVRRQDLDRYEAWLTDGA